MKLSKTKRQVLSVMMSVLIAKGAALPSVADNQFDQDEPRQGRAGSDRF